MIDVPDEGIEVKTLPKRLDTLNGLPDESFDPTDFGPDDDD